MLKRFVCLANSFKEGGRCLAGIELDSNSKPVIENRNPVWVRPVCNTLHGEIPTNLVANLKVLNVIEIDITNRPAKTGYQSENVFFRDDSIKVVGKYIFNSLNQLCSNSSLIFGNRGKAVSEEAIKTLSHSLMLINTDQFKVTEITYADSPGKSKLRLVFSHKGSQYDLPITDAAFIHNYHNNPGIINNAADVYLCLSLGLAHINWHYKLVAGIIYNNIINTCTTF